MYEIVISLYTLGVAVMSLFNDKVKKMWRGEREAFRVLRNSVDPDSRYVWFHAASLVEFEQGRPLMEELKRRTPEVKIVLTFFSPSGYEVRKNYAGADVILVADIDRGGVFASVYGSVMLQTPEDRKRIKGIIVNKFRGDIRLFEPGIKMMEELCGIPVLGVVPYYKDIHIEEEDSVVLDYKRMQAIEGKVNVAVVLLRHLSNFTDFNMLERDERVHLYYTNNTEELAKADIILLPGSKSTLDDLYELRRNGVAQAILRAHRKGASVMGICGGYQMMGMEVRDPDGVEGDIRQLPGLGLLPMITTMQGEKVTRRVAFHFRDNETVCRGYEIHMGETELVSGSPVSPLNKLEDGKADGYFVDRKCMGSYIHGILDNQVFIDFLLEPYADKLHRQSPDYEAYKEEQYDKLAAHVRKHLNLPLLYQIMCKND